MVGGLRSGLVLGCFFDLGLAAFAGCCRSLAHLYIFNYTNSNYTRLAIFSDPCRLDFFDLFNVLVVCDADCLERKCCGGNHAVTH